MAPDRPSPAARLWSWLPALAGLINSYGPVAYNYGFALYFLSWNHGFVKRGLVGEMLLAFSTLTRSELIVVEFLFILAAIALTYLVFNQLLFGTLEDRILAA